MSDGSNDPNDPRPTTPHRCYVLDRGHHRRVRGRLRHPAAQERDPLDPPEDTR